MSESNPPPETSEVAATPPQEADSGKKKKIILGSLFFVTVICCVIGGLWIGGVFGNNESADSPGDERTDTESAQTEGEMKDAQAGSEESTATEVDSVFYEIPEILVNLASRGQRTRFLKITVNLELSNANDVEIIEKNLPRITDGLQVYLRELRPEDLQGSAGMHYLREELLKRLRLSAAPANVRDILFREILIQ